MYNTKMENLEQLYSDYMNIHYKNMLDGYSNLAIAGILMAQALTIYRSVLTAEEYDQLLEFVVENKDNVKTFNSPTTDSLH